MTAGSFIELGYQRFPELFSPAEISLVKSSVQELIDSMTPASRAWQNACALSDLKATRNPGIPREAIEGIPFIIGELPKFSDSIRAFLCREELWAMASDLLKSDHVVYHFANVTRKPAFVGPNISWHRDYPNAYICTQDSARFFRALIPLETMNRENGCTEVIPGTHRLSDETALRLYREKRQDFDTREAIPLTSNPGDVLAIHPKIVHGGKENRSHRDRDLIVVQFGVATGAYLHRTEECFTGFAREQILRAVIEAF